LPKVGGLELLLKKEGWELVRADGGSAATPVGFSEFMLSDKGRLFDVRVEFGYNDYMHNPPLWDWLAEKVRHAGVVVNALYYDYEIDGNAEFSVLADVVRWNYRLALTAKAYGIPYVLLTGGRVYSEPGIRGCSPILDPPLADSSFLFWQIEKDALLHGGHVVRLPEMFSAESVNPLTDEKDVRDQPSGYHNYRMQLDGRPVSLAPAEVITQQLMLFVEGLKKEDPPLFWSTHRVINLGIPSTLDDVGSWMDATLRVWNDYINKDWVTWNRFNQGAQAWSFMACPDLGRFFALSRTSTYLDGLKL